MTNPQAATVVAEPTTAPVVQLTGISKEFPGVKALQDVNFRMFPGEVHALMGENGAGKSTLIKALTGVYSIDSGEVLVSGKPHRFSGPGEAQAAGISTVYQEVNLCENLSVAENIMLGHEPRSLGTINWRATRRAAATYLERMGLDINPGSSLGSHSLAIQQLVAISRAMVVDAKVLILDEPTSSLDTDEVEQLFGVMRQLRDEGVAILFVSHFLEQIYAVSDRMTVLRNGQLVGEYLTADLSRVELISKMIGREMEALDELQVGTEASSDGPGSGVPYIEAAGLGRRGSIEPFDLTVHAGEVVGLAGLLGSGRTELARLLAGADRADSGTTRIKGEEVKLRSPQVAIEHDIVYSSEDRKREGIVGDLTVRENIILGIQAERGWMRRIPARQVDEVVDEYMEALNIRPANPDMLIKNLSGGNQQKALLARWLATKPELLILDEPTRGIDVGAKAEIQKLVARLATDGMAVLFISAELDEVVRLSNRIAVLRDRQKVGEIVNGDDVGVSDVVALIASGTESSDD